MLRATVVVENGVLLLSLLGPSDSAVESVVSPTLASTFEQQRKLLSQKKRMN